MTFRTTLAGAAGLTVAVILTSGLSACVPTPQEVVEPTPTFSDEAEAFAAAERTYLEYIDAVNARREDPAARDPQDFLVNDALRIDIETQRQLKEQRLTLTGSTRVLRVSAESISLQPPRVNLSVCVDSTETRVIDVFGQEITPSDREERSLLDVQLDFIGMSFRIAASELVEGAAC